MTTLAFIFIASDAPKAQLFPSKAAALQYRNDWFMPESAEELAAQNILAPTSGMVALFNAYAPTPVKKFTDRETAAKRLWNLLMEKLTMTDTTTDAVAEAANKKAQEQAAKKAEAERVAAERKAEKEAKATAKAEEKAKKQAEREAKKAEREAAKANRQPGDKTRQSKFTGKLLKHKVAKDADGNVKNPRRPGSHGERSLQIILDAGDAGISLADYQAKGGRMNDLHWDVDHGNVVAVDAPAAAAE